MIPVWKDRDVYISATEPLKYFIEYLGGDTVFEGVAMPKPDTTNITIRINDFAKNMVDSNVNADIIFDIQGDMDYHIIPNYCREIAIGKRNENSGNTLIFSDYFCNDYDYNSMGEYVYDDVYELNSKLGKIVGKGHTFFTVFNTYEHSISFDFGYKMGIDATNNFGNIYIPAMTAIILIVRDLPVGAEVYYNFEGFPDVTLGKVVDSCNSYKLHFINAKGGYETLPIDGRKDKRTDSLTFEYYKTRGNNQNINKPQMNKFKVDVTPKWELQTGWLNDEQSQKMYNLFTSQKVWLENIETGEITPVYITNNAVDYKTFTNNGKRKINYTISVTSANTLIKL